MVDKNVTLAMYGELIQSEDFLSLSTATCAPEIALCSLMIEKLSELPDFYTYPEFVEYCKEKGSNDGVFAAMYILSSVASGFKRMIIVLEKTYSNHPVQ